MKGRHLVVKIRLVHFGDANDYTSDESRCERETERWERGTPAPWLDELEPEAMSMGDGVSVVSEGGG
jgi:hypothetical protein